MTRDSNDGASDTSETIAYVKSFRGGRGKSVAVIDSEHNMFLQRKSDGPFPRSRSQTGKHDDYSSMPWSDFQARLRKAKSGYQDMESVIIDQHPSPIATTEGLFRIKTLPTPKNGHELSKTSSSSRSSSDDWSARDSSGDELSDRQKDLVHTDDVDKDVAIKNAVETMRRNFDDVQEQERDLRTLMELSTNDIYREIIGFHGGIAAIISALATFPDEDNIQELGMHLLVDVCIASDSNRKFAAQYEVAKTLVMLMKNRRNTKQKLIASTLRAITHCCKQNLESQSLAGTCGGVGEIIKTMTCKAYNTLIELHCLRALESIAAQHDENTERIRMDDGVGAVLRMMRRNGDCPVTNELATEILVHLLANSEDTQIYIGRIGGVKDVLHALHLATGSETAVTSACLCLRYLAFDEDNRRRMSSLSGVRAIMKTAEAMKGSSAETNASILLALANATFDDYANKSAAAREGGVSTLVSIMAIYEEETEVVEYACRVLRNISDSRQRTKKSCFKHGSVAAVAAAMKKHVDISGIQEHGAAMLINMMNSFSQAVRAAKMEDHLETVCDVHSLNEFTFAQVHHLAEMLRKPSGLSGIIQRKAVDTFASLHSISSTGGTAIQAVPSSSSTTFHHFDSKPLLGHEKSIPTTGALSHLSSTDSLHRHIESPCSATEGAPPTFLSKLSHHSNESIDY